MMSEISRQLATIMFSDIVGYSRMMNEDEQKAIRLRKEVERVIKHLAPKYDGEVIQFYGDGALIMFDSNVEAVQCAFLIQKTIHEIGEIQIRIGIHVGDITLESGQIYGETVNIASRIETFCTPGAIMFSSRVYEDLRNQPEFVCKNLGLFRLKNIKRPLRMYALDHPAISVPDSRDLRGKGVRSQKSIAVMPFVNMSPEKENEYFSDGISEEILNTLSKEEALRVTARTSSFTYKDSKKDVREIGKELNVEYLLEGSVRRAGNRVRITAQLIHAPEGFHVLSETYDRTLDDIFAVQDEIALNISNLLRETLGLDSREEISHAYPTGDLNAYQDYLKGLFYWNRYDHNNARKALHFLDKAIKKDPSFAEAYAFKSFAYSFLGGTGQIRAESVFPLAIENAEKALSIQPQSVEANCAKGLVALFWEWDFIKAEGYFNKAKAIARQSAAFLYSYSIFLRAAGRFVEAVEVLEEAVVIDPVSFISNIYLAEAYATNKQYPEAFEQIKHAEELFPKHSYFQLTRAWLNVYQGKYEEALRIAREKVLKDDPVLEDLVALRGLLWGLTGHMERARACMERLRELEKEHPDADFGFLFTCVSYGLNDRGFIKRRLREVTKGSKGGLILAFSNPFWNKILNEPWLEEEVSLIRAQINR